jgi:predicted RNA methylase
VDEIIDEKIWSKIGYLMNSASTGLDIDMINNKVRNNFYDKILKKCKNKKCIEVGGGTGLLSIIALKHGATHVTCFEHDLNTYNALNNAIKYCNLQSKITLINENFTSYSIEKHNLYDCELIFHELFGKNLWNDPGWPLRGSFDKKINIEIIPNKLVSNFYIAEVKDEKFVSKLLNKSNIPKFNPGIEVDEKFVEFYNNCIYKFNNCKDLAKHTCIVKKIKPLTKFNLEKKDFKKIYTHCFDLNHSNYLETKIKINLPKSKNPYILTSNCKVECDDNQIFTWQFCGSSEIFFISCASDDVYFELNTLTGIVKIDDIVVSVGDSVDNWYREGQVKYLK